MTSKLLLVIIPAVIAGIFGIATIMLDNNQDGEGGDTISVIHSANTTIITGDQIIINQYTLERQELTQNQLLILEAHSIEPQIDQTQEKEIPQETLQTIEKQRKEIDRLSKELENAGQEQTVDIDLLLRESSAYYYSGDYEKMLVLTETILTFDPNNVIALSNKGLALGSLGQHEEAIKFFDKALAIDPNYVLALNNKGVALDSLGQYEEAIEFFDKALAIDPNYVLALYNKGAALASLGQYEEAIKSYDKALAIDPNHVKVLYHKNKALQQLK